MHPKLQLDTVYLPVEDGVYLRNNRGGLKIKGKTTYTWLERLAPYLNGQHSLEDLTGGLDENRKEMVAGLVKTLLTHHFLVDASLDEPHTLSQAELDTYAAEIAFIESFQPSAPRRFEAFRHTRVLVISSGISGSALIRSCLHSGIQSLSIIKTASEEAVPTVFSPLDDSTLLLPHDPAQRVRELVAPRWDDKEDVLNALGPFDAILSLSDRPMLARARLLNTLCVEQGKLLFQACFVDDHAWIGPLVKPGIEGCWECAWRRLQATVQEHERRSLYDFQDYGVLEPGRWFAFPAAAVVANLLVLGLLKTVTGAGPQAEDTGEFTSVNLETITSKSHAFFPHPCCQVCQHPPAPTEAAFLQQLAELQQREPLDSATFSQRAARCFDARSGIFTEIGEGNFEQVPLAVCKVAISNPMRLQPQHVLAVGRDFKTARARATRRACEVYASTVVDVRRLVSLKMPGALDLDRFVTTASPAFSVNLWNWALNLATQQPSLLPAPLVFPSLWSQEVAGANAIGIGSGMSWEEAVCQGLLDWARYLTVAQRGGVLPLSQKLDPLSLPLTTEGNQWLRLLATVDAQPDIYDVTGSLGVPTFAICTKTHILTSTSHFDKVEALVLGLEQALRQYQATAARQPEYALDSVEPLRTAMNTERYREAPHIVVPQSWPGRQRWLVQRFWEYGWHPVVSPLNHDPSLIDALPFLVRVLLVRAESEKER